MGEPYSRCSLGHFNGIPALPLRSRYRRWNNVVGGMCVERAENSFVVGRKAKGTQFAGSPGSDCLILWRIFRKFQKRWRRYFRRYDRYANGWIC